MRLTVLLLGCALTAVNGASVVMVADEKLAAKATVEDSREWFHSKFADPSSGWAECALTFCKHMSGETEVFSYASRDPTHYLRRSASTISRSSQPRNRALLNDNRNYGSEHWHCEQDPGHVSGCKCMCSPDTDCNSVKHADRFVKVCDGQDVEVQYTKSKHHTAIIASIDAGVALIAGTNGVGHACRAGTYNTDGIGACKPHTKCSAGQVLTDESATTPGSCTVADVGPTVDQCSAIRCNGNSFEGVQNGNELYCQQGSWENACSYWFGLPAGTLCYNWGQPGCTGPTRVGVWDRLPTTATLDSANPGGSLDNCRYLCDTMSDRYRGGHNCGNSCKYGCEWMAANQ